MDPTEHRARTKLLVREMKARLGADAYRAFKAASAHFQAGQLSDVAYLALAASQLRDPRLLSELVALLPEPQVRGRVKSPTHLRHPQTAPHCL